MDEHGLYLNLTDEVEISINSFIKDAKNTHDLNNLCGFDDGPNPYETLMRQLEYIQAKILPDAIEYVDKLRSHTCEADEDYFCKVCGKDLNV